MIQLRNINKEYMLDGKVTRALHDITLTIKKGEFVAIMGPSGSGKSTLLNTLGCLDNPTSGEFLFNGLEINKQSDKELAGFRNKEIGFVFQSFNLLARTTAVDNVLLPAFYSHPPKIGKERAVKLLEQVGLGDRLDHWPNKLSGGQQQRVAIARALMNEPSLILADEPTGALDSQSSSEIMQILQQLNNEGKTIIMVTHDPNLIEYSKRVINLKDGRIIEDKLITNSEKKSV